MNIGFIGTGVMTAAMVEGLSENGHNIFVSERNKELSSRLAKEFSDVRVVNNQSVLDNSEAVILAMNAPVAKQVIPTLEFQTSHKVLSVMVGFDYQELQSLLPHVTEVTFFIPWPFIAQGGSPLLVYPESATLETMFGANNSLLVMENESMMNSYLSAQALLSPITKQLLDTSDWLAKRTNNETSAEDFVRLLVGGYLNAVPIEQKGVIKKMLADLSTEGGLNAQLNQHYADNGVYSTLEQGLDILEKRLNA